MDTSKVRSLLEQLDDDVDDLEESLDPLHQTALSETSSKLPLLDKAKLYVLVTYAIESILFSYLRLNGVNARVHPVFTELTRVKQYFAKVQLAENPIGKRENLNLDKGAAARMIRAGLEGNSNYDLERAEQQAKERARAHMKFVELSEKMKQDEISKKRKVEDTHMNPSNSDSDSDSSSSVAPVESERTAPRVSNKNKKKKRKVELSGGPLGSLPNSGVSSASEKSKGKKHSKEKSKGPKTKKQSV